MKFFSDVANHCIVNDNRNGNSQGRTRYALASVLHKMQPWAAILKDAVFLLTFYCYWFFCFYCSALALLALCRTLFQHKFFISFLRSLTLRFCCSIYVCINVHMHVCVFIWYTCKAVIAYDCVCVIRLSDLFAFDLFICLYIYTYIIRNCQILINW